MTARTLEIGVPARLRKLIMFPLAFVFVAVLWEGYKAIGPENGGTVLGMRLLPRTGDRAMPHVWEMVFGERLGVLALFGLVISLLGVAFVTRTAI